MSGEAEKKAQMHGGHRERMRNRYFQGGFDGFSDHELIEVMLYYALPRQDTNGLAHELLDRFGGIKGIFNATDEELSSVKGIGDSAVVLKSLLIELMRRYVNEKLPPNVSYHSVSRIAEFFVNRYRGVANEQLYMMMLNNRMNMIDCVLISEGSVSYSTAPVRVMTEKALQRRATSVVLAHNHPNGLAIPSSADIEMTEIIAESLRMIGVQLLEHVVIADDRFYPIMQERFGRMNRSPVTGLLENPFFEDFYDVDPKTWVAASPFEEKGKE